MPPELHLDPNTLDVGRIVADKEAIRKMNPQRFEMEQLDAIVYEDTEKHVIAGYKDVRDNEFWVRGHMPGFPLMPGVMMCEAAAQLCGYYSVKNDLLFGDFIAFSGMEKVRFRGIVRIGDRFLLVGKAIRINRRQTIFDVQGFVNNNLVFNGDIIGVPYKLGS